MKKSILIAALVLATGLLAARPSQAQQAGGQVISQNSSNNEGVFNVLATEEIANPLKWDITVTYVSTFAGVVPSPAFLDGLNMEFYSDGATVSGTELTNQGTIDKIASVTGGVGAFSWTGPNSSEPGSQLFFQYEDSSGTGGQTQVNGYDHDGLITAGQTFTGTVTLAAGTDPVDAIKFGVQNSGEVNAWFATMPEGQSMALLLPALLPLGMVIRRRRKA
jgi:hypothetical protein